MWARCHASQLLQCVGATCMCRTCRRPVVHPVAAPSPHPPPPLPRVQPQSSYADSVRSPPLEGLDNHTDKFQVDGFNRALSARSGSKGLGRLLTFGRSPKPSAGGSNPATPEHLQLTTDDMLQYSEVGVGREGWGQGGGVGGSKGGGRRYRGVREEEGQRYHKQRLHGSCCFALGGLLHMHPWPLLVTAACPSH